MPRFGCALPSRPSAVMYNGSFLENVGSMLILICHPLTCDGQPIKRWDEMNSEHRRVVRLQPLAVGRSCHWVDGCTFLARLASTGTRESVKVVVVPRFCEALAGCDCRKATKHGRVGQLAHVYTPNKHPSGVAISIDCSACRAPGEHWL